MKLSGLLAAMGFLVCGASILFTVMTLLSDDSEKGMTVLTSALIFFNGLIAIGVAELLTNTTKLMKKVEVTSHDEHNTKLNHFQ
ncbi:hypothetical protein MKY84_13480 [Chryseomicrobium sp. FSL W7-1435]|uniref:hypothetical protein n=1 Tax=Chryseomicrobium sp. FSL W7-1435 TaxID=2921704 RepID=UPI00315A0E5D